MNSSVLAPIVPRNAARAKRIAKQLTGLYPNRTLSECQEVTAKLFGHASWFDFQNSIKLKLPSAIFDDEHDDDNVVGKRMGIQADILCRTLGHTDPDRDYSPPNRGASPEDRLEMAVGRWHQDFGFDVVNDLAPTSLSVPRPVQVPRLVSSHSPEIVASLPSRLGAWWKKNVSHQPEVGAQLSSLIIDVNQRTSLKMFGAHWGELCFYYAHATFGPPLLGVPYLLAQRYADLQISEAVQSNSVERIAAELDPSSANPSLSALERLHHAFCVTYLVSYPRDDIAPLYSAQPDALRQSADDFLRGKVGR